MYLDLSGFVDVAGFSPVSIPFLDNCSLVVVSCAFGVVVNVIAGRTGAGCPVLLAFSAAFPVLEREKAN